MHVTIVQLTSKPTNYRPSDDDVFGDNQDKFPDGVEKHKGKDSEEDVSDLIGWLGDAATTGVELVNGKKVRWIKIDRSNAIELFMPYFHNYLSIVGSMHNHDIRDFATGGHGLGEAIRRLNEAYNFDGFYIVGDCTYAQPISDWLRCLISTADVPTKWYVGATYDGDQ